MKMILGLLLLTFSANAKEVVSSREIAESELSRIRAKEKSENPKNTATVNVTVPKWDADEMRSRVELGAGAEWFTPEGEVPLTGFQTYSLSQIKPGAMAQLSFGWFPATTSWGNLDDPWRLGVRASLGYMSSNVELNGPNGYNIPKNNAQFFMPHAQVLIQKAILPKWGLNFIAGPGVGRLQYVQTSSQSVANIALSREFVSGTVGLRKTLFEKLLIYTDYQYRSLAAGEDSLRISQNVFSAGILGAL